MLNDLVVRARSGCLLPEMDWGPFVTGGVTHLLPLTVGYQRAMELFHGDARALRGLSYGIVNRVVPKGEMLDCAMDLATHARNPLPTSKLKQR
jgi:enoyl-CoA hydratase/carnithine racemase